MSKNILVTGGAGYIGSHACKALKERGYTPIVYDNLCSGNAWAVKWGPFIEGDIRDREKLSCAIKEHAPLAIMHFAALIQVAESVKDPSLYYNNNVYGSLCLLEEARLHQIRHMVFSSTAAVYGLPDTSPIDEDDEKAPINPYGRTKLITEGMISDYSNAYGLQHAILRYFNAAGADPQSKTGTAYKVDTHIIPLLMRVACGQLDQIKIFGKDYPTPDGTAIRDYIHVTDLAEAHILSLEHILNNKGSITLNLGTSNGFSVSQVVEAARKITGKDIPEIQVERREGDPPILVANSKKAQEVLNWIPKYSDLDTIIQTAWKWKQSNSH
jgi:UDP-arabinose 4-epimerase